MKAHVANAIMLNLTWYIATMPLTLVARYNQELHREMGKQFVQSSKGVGENKMKKKTRVQ